MKEKFEKEVSRTKVVDEVILFNLTNIVNRLTSLHNDIQIIKKQLDTIEDKLDE